MSSSRDTRSLKDSLLSEITDEISSLNGSALDEYLVSIGLDPAQLLNQSKAAFSAAIKHQKMARLKDAQQHLKKRNAPNMAVIVDYDVAKKKSLMQDIQKKIEQSGEMTLAARNQNIESEDDLDSFLEACLRLGLIDDEGNLID
ncbi:MAG: hypothetical protein HKN14_04540 [Marinicaulis sp.]|nr:hypothetical protein [Marinicaulis sp.]